MRLLLSLLLWTAGLAAAGEYAVFPNEGRLHIDHHEYVGSTVRLFTGGGSIEMDAASVRGFEAEEAVSAPPAKPSVAAASALDAEKLTPQRLADRAAEKYGLPPQLVRSVMKAESGYAPQAISPKGAIGLMQLMPQTAQTLGADPHDPAENVDAGARYLRELLEKYHGGLRHALAAYNAGPAAVERYRGIPPYRETVDYIRRVEQDFKKAE